MLRYNPEARVQEILRGKALSLPESNYVLGPKAVPFLLERAFLGQPQNLSARTPSGRLSTKQVQDLEALGITCNKYTYYHRGAINAATKNGQPLDARALYEYLRALISLACAIPQSELARDCQALLRGLELCTRAQMALL